MVLEICGRKIESGTRSYFQLRVARLLDGTEVSIPLHVLRGRRDGVTLALFASVHGTEYYHNRAVRRIVKETDLSGLSGTILAVPVANPMAFGHTSRDTPCPPEDPAAGSSNMNRVFPGKRLIPLFGSMDPSDISLTMKMAAILTEQVLDRCDCLIDLHGHSLSGSMKKMVYNEQKEALEFARIFGLGIIHDTAGEFQGPFVPAFTYVGRQGKPGLCPEIGGYGHSESYEREVERLDVQGIYNVMEYLKMLKGEPVLPKRQFYFKNAPHIRTGNGGYLISNMEAEDVGIGRPTREVRKGELLGTIYDPYTCEETDRLEAPADGLLYMSQTTCLLEANTRSIGIGDFKESKWIE